MESHLDSNLYHISLFNKRRSMLYSHRKMFVYAYFKIRACKEYGELQYMYGKRHSSSTTEVILFSVVKKKKALFGPSAEAGVR